MLLFRRSFSDGDALSGRTVRPSELLYYIPFQFVTSITQMTSSLYNEMEILEQYQIS